MSSQSHTKAHPSLNLKRRPFKSFWIAWKIEKPNVRSVLKSLGELRNGNSAGAWPRLTKRQFRRSSQGPDRPRFVRMLRANFFLCGSSLPWMETEKLLFQGSWPWSKIGGLVLSSCQRPLGRLASVSFSNSGTRLLVGEGASLCYGGPPMSSSRRLSCSLLRTPHLMKPRPFAFWQESRLLPAKHLACFLQLKHASVTMCMQQADSL